MIFLYSYIDGTVLGPAVKNDDVTAMAEDAQANSFASICIPPYFVEEIKKSYGDITIGSVIGFPQGIQSIQAKQQEIKNLADVGVDELDIVINLNAATNDNLQFLDREMKALLEVKGNIVYKMILETCLWNDDQLMNIVKFYAQYPVEYLKTSTGFNGPGATPRAVEIMMKYKAPDQKIKASGGIRTYEDGANYVELGVSRIGTSSPKPLLVTP